MGDYWTFESKEPRRRMPWRIEFGPTKWECHMCKPAVILGTDGDAVAEHLRYTHPEMFIGE